MLPLPYGVTHQVIALGDFNNDGYLDMVVTSQEDDTVVVVWLNNGDGTFSGGAVYDAGAYPVTVAVGDFNNDGNLDIVTGNDDGTVSVLLGNGDGTFQAPPSQRPSVGFDSFSIAVGDLDHDGNLDIVFANYDDKNNMISALLGNGDGTFQEPPLTYHVGPGGIVAVAVGDFTHNRNLDIVTANASFNPSVSVLLGNGDGTFPTQKTYSPVGYATPGAVAVGDFTNDGNLDIVTADLGLSLSPHSHTVSVLLGKGDGTFGPSQNYSVDNYPIDVAVGDFNHDGNLDIVTANQNANTISVLLGNGDGTFTAAKGSPYSVGNGNSPLAVAVGDVDNDGNLDIVTANNAVNSITIFYGNGDGTFQPQYP